MHADMRFNRWHLNYCLIRPFVWVLESILAQCPISFLLSQCYLGFNWIVMATAFCTFDVLVASVSIAVCGFSWSWKGSQKIAQRGLQCGQGLYPYDYSYCAREEREAQVRTCNSSDVPRLSWKESLVHTEKKNRHLCTFSTGLPSFLGNLHTTPLHWKKNRHLCTCTFSTGSPSFLGAYYSTTLKLQSILFTCWKAALHGYTPSKTHTGGF